MLRFCLFHFQPYARSRWQPSMEFFTLSSHQSHKGSKIWNRVVAAWEKMLPDVSFVEPQCFEEFLNTSFWWNEYVAVIGAGFSRSRAGELHARGLRRIRDAWHHDQVCFLSCKEVVERFDLSTDEFGAWEAALTSFRDQWGGFQSGHVEFLREYQHVGLFRDADDTLPICVVEYQEDLRIPLRNQGIVESRIPLSCPIYTVKERTRCLSCTDAQRRAAVAIAAPDSSGPASLIIGAICKVRVVDIVQGQRKIKSSLYHGRIDRLDFDPSLVKYHDDIGFMSYTTKSGKALLKRHHQIPNLARKWIGVLPEDHQFRWTTVWSKGRTIKEAGLLWSAWNKDLTVNDWHGSTTPILTAIAPHARLEQPRPFCTAFGNAT